MPYDPNRHHRRSIRLRNYDYSSEGAYFITICVEHRLCLFGNVIDDKMVLNDAGHTIERAWLALPERFATIEFDVFIVMPNHFHGIIILHSLNSVPEGAGTSPAPTKDVPILGNAIGAFKSLSTHDYMKGVRESNWEPFTKRLWQRNYYEHIIRTADEFEQTQGYIMLNPLNWHEDREHPKWWPA